MNYKSAHKPMS